MHYWIGSYCRNRKDNDLYFPNKIIGISDTVTILEDLGNKIPKDSWMLYLLEFFNSKKVPVELNLICQFDDKNYFEAIFNGKNRYKFKQIQPCSGNSYSRIIINDLNMKSIKYILIDRTSNEKEEFNFQSNELDQYNYNIIEQFTGIEWWNKRGYYPYKIRYKIRISEIMFGIEDYNKSVTFHPYTSLIPNKDNRNEFYPISFKTIVHNTKYLEYIIDSGMCKNGIYFNS